MATFPDESEVRILTGRVRHGARVRALRGMGIEHVVRPDGSPVVLRSHVETEMGNAGSRRRPERSWTPDLEEVR
uniref:DUF4224 domain-containing protein n=1 Tax=Candidatus Kentrum sp. DK TaxID=2126562 RepID=A0A450T5F5_9GAMM|nr:MAG: protein of unknown function (DUF4224) [Candidatus Kentron sp. DK]